MTGFNRDACVIETAKGALDNGYTVVSCEQLMFSLPSTHNKRSESMAFYRTRTKHIDTAEEVIAFLADYKN